MFLSSELFLDCIFLTINECSDRTCESVGELVSIYESESKNSVVSGDDLTRFYIRVLKDIIGNKITKKRPDELKMILLKFKSDRVVSTRRDVYDLLMEAFSSEQETPVERLEQYANRIMNALLWHRTGKELKRSLYSYNKAAELLNANDQNEELSKILSGVNKIRDIYAESSSPTANSKRALIGRVDFSNEESLANAFGKGQERLSTGILKTGLQGLNRACGERGGFMRGESVMFCARSHNYKSGLLQSCAMWFPLYNVPNVKDGLRPLILMVSLENEEWQNAMWIFRQQYKYQTGLDPRNLTEQEIVSWVYEVFNKNGYTLIIERHLPSDFGFAELTALVEYYESIGYEVVALILDYMSNMKKGMGTNNTNTGNHLLVKYLANAICNYTKNKDITFITAHQLNRDADKIEEQSKQNRVKLYGPQHLAESTDVHREVDLDFALEIEKDFDGIAYLTVRRWKHRYVDNTPESHKYFAYRFHDNLGIPDDINGPATFITNIYANANDFNNTNANDNGVQNVVFGSAANDLY